MTKRVLRWVGLLALALVVGGGSTALAGKGGGKGKPGGGDPGGEVTNPAFAYVSRDNPHKRQIFYDEIHLMTSDGSAEISLGVGKSWAVTLSRGMSVRIPYLAWSPDLDGADGYQGALAYVLSLGANVSGGGLYTIDIDIAADGAVTVGSETFLIGLGSEPGGPIAWSPDGSRIAYVEARTIRTLVVGDLSSEVIFDAGDFPVPSEERPSAGGEDASLSWSPDQDAATAGYQGQLAYHVGPSLRVLDVEIAGGVATGGDRTVLSSRPGTNCSWAPDGSVILIEWWNDHDDGYTDGDWFAVDPVTDTFEYIPGIVAYAGRVNLSPDVAHYVWATGGEIYRMPVGSTTSVNLTGGTSLREEFAVWCPAWSNDLD